MGKSIQRDFRNILIVKPSAMGDVITALPILTPLRQKFPQAKIAWLVATRWAPLLRGHPLIDEIVEFDRRRFGYVGRSWVVSKRFGRFLRSLRDRRYDLVLDLQGLFRSSFLTWATRAAVRIGPAEKRELGWLFYTHRCPPSPTNTHVVDRILSAGQLLDLDVSNPTFPLPVSDDARQSVARALRDRLDRRSDYVTFTPGATWASKRWPAQHFAELARMVVDELDLPVVLTGANGERPLCDQVVEQSRSPRVVNLAGQTALPELVALIAAAKAVVCNDSGAMHLAVALNRPLSVVIGPTNADRTGPYRRPESILQAHCPDAPCLKRTCEKLPDPALPAPCMESVSAKHVFDNLVSQLAAT
ncbi:MAG: lipopolysaccharide heptosyltransferase II [Phycisphaerae bacterium]|nr:lipopolysaccharide heptosyltransferase II [Phycisphaerae bacterium]